MLKLTQVLKMFHELHHMNFLYSTYDCDSKFLTPLIKTKHLLFASIQATTENETTGRRKNHLTAHNIVKLY